MYTIIRHGHKNAHFSARNDNHAIRRVVKTLSRLVHGSATLSRGGAIVAHIETHTASPGWVAVNNARFSMAKFAGSFPG